MDIQTEVRFKDSPQFCTSGTRTNPVLKFKEFQFPQRLSRMGDSLFTHKVNTLHGTGGCESEGRGSLTDKDLQ